MADAETAVAAERDELLARLLAELTETLQQGGRPDLDAVALSHPDIADELRELWGVARLAGELVTPSARPAPSAPTPNHLPRTFGNFELLEELGRGGMGLVFKARQRMPERTVALKMILRGDLASGPDLARFRAEAQSAAKLDHPNIVPVYEVGAVDGQAFFSMKLVEGTTLARRLAHGPMPEREAATCLAAIARAVQYAHERGILHRDLKPSNVLLDAQGIPYVADFGLAKQVEGGTQLTPSRAIVGTPSYIAPEQADSSRGQLGPASDVYSLGAILYEMLTGRPPYQAASYLDTIHLVLEGELVPPHVLVPKVNRELESICLKCLEKQPRLRYASAGALADDLDAFLAGEPTAAQPISLRYFLLRLWSETHHANVLMNWGGLWMAHSVKILLICVFTAYMKWSGEERHWPYLLLWTVGLMVWGAFFWSMRRRLGPVTAVERQFAHIWASGIAGCVSIFAVEWLLGYPVLSLSPALAVVAGMVFVVKAGLLSGYFYLAAALMFATIGPMVAFPNLGLVFFGLASAVCFFIPGFKYFRRRRSAPPAT